MRRLTADALIERLWSERFAAPAARCVGLRYRPERMVSAFLAKEPYAADFALRAEPENPHDDAAVVVLWRGERVGYIAAKFEALHLSRAAPDFDRVAVSRVVLSPRPGGDPVLLLDADSIHRACINAAEREDLHGRVSRLPSRRIGDEFGQGTTDASHQ